MCVRVDVRVWMDLYSQKTLGRQPDMHNTCLCMSVAYGYAHTYTDVHPHVYADAYMHVYAHVYTDVHTQMSIHMSTHMSVCRHLHKEPRLGDGP